MSRLEMAKSLKELFEELSENSEKIFDGDKI
jgi:hypothetical protein